MLSSTVAERLPAMCGSETLAMLVSSTSMNVASITVAAISHGLTAGVHGTGTVAAGVSTAATLGRSAPFHLCDFVQYGPDDRLVADLGADHQVFHGFGCALAAGSMFALDGDGPDQRWGLAFHFTLEADGRWAVGVGESHPAILSRQGPARSQQASRWVWRRAD